MRIRWKFLPLVLLAAGPLLLAGCGGISASRTVSPLDFLLPGIIRNDSPRTNAPVVARNAGQAFQPAGSGDFRVACSGSTGLESPVNSQAGMPALHASVIFTKDSVEVASVR